MTVKRKAVFVNITPKACKVRPCSYKRHDSYIKLEIFITKTTMSTIKIKMIADIFEHI